MFYEWLHREIKFSDDEEKIFVSLTSEVKATDLGLSSYDEGILKDDLNSIML